MARRTTSFFVLIAAISLFLLAVNHLFAFVVVLTGSMEPAVPKGSLVVIARFGGWRVGDVVLYRAGGALVLHRIIEEGDGVFRTKGDASQSRDPWLVPSEAVIGKAVFSIPFLGRMLFALREPLVFASVTTSIYFISLSAPAWRSLIKTFGMGLLRGFRVRGRAACACKRLRLRPSPLLHREDAAAVFGATRQKTAAKAM